MPRPRLSLFVLTVAAMATAACVDPIDLDVGEPAAMGAEAYPEIAAAGQTITIGVRVIDNMGRPVGNVTVTWAVVSGDGQVTPINAETDDSGLAQAQWTLGIVEGEQMVRASVRRLQSVEFVVNTGDPDIG